MSTRGPGLNRNTSKEVNSEEQYRIFGDELDKRKSKNIIRIVFQNINGFGVSKESNKAELIRKMIEEKDMP